MKQLLSLALLAAASCLAVSAHAQTATKPPPRPAPAAKPVATAVQRPAPHATVRRPVFVPAPPVIELDEMAVVPDLPTVLSNEDRDRYRRIFQAQAAGQWAAADAEFPKLTDKVLAGYVGAQRILGPGYVASYDQLAAWLQEYNDHPDAPAIYRLAVARRPPGADDLTPASFVSQVQSSPAFAAARTVSGADAGRATEMRARLAQMLDDGGYNTALVTLERS